jgi:hypothetical protein
MAFNKTQYDIEYAKEHITRKFLSFNHDDPNDAALLEWLNSQGKGKVTAYIKRLIVEDMKKAAKNADS